MIVGVPIAAGVRVGHIHLKVADLERSLAFYCGVLGFELMQRYGTGAAFVSAGGYHHHIGLNTWESAGGDPPPQALRAFITWHSFIRRGPILLTHCGGSRPRAFIWMVRAITE